MAEGWIIGEWIDEWLKGGKEDAWAMIQEGKNKAQSYQVTDESHSKSHHGVVGYLNRLTTGVPAPPGK